MCVFKGVSRYPSRALSSVRLALGHERNGVLGQGQGEVSETEY